MCLMLYVGSREQLREQSGPDLRIEPVEPGRRAVQQWFSLPSVQFVGARTGCSCRFPHVIAAETPIEYWDGMWSDSDERGADVRSMRALIELLRAAIKPGELVELYPDTSHFTEQFLYQVRAEPARSR